MADNKTRPTRASVTEFMNAIGGSQVRADSKKVAATMRHATGKRARMWGPSIVGYGSYHYRYASGREGDFMITRFSPRKQALTVYIRRLADVDEDVLDQLIRGSVEPMRAHYETG